MQACSENSDILNVFGTVFHDDEALPEPASFTRKTEAQKEAAIALRNIKATLMGRRNNLAAKLRREASKRSPTQRLGQMTRGRLVRVL